MKKLLILATLMVVGSFASASTLYWQLDQTEADNFGEKNWDYAVLMGTTGPLNNTGTAISAIAKDDLTYDLVDSGALTSYTSFYVELRDSGDNRIGATDLVAASTINSYLYSGGMGTPTAYEFSGFQAGVIPEPSSALLVLIGAMALGLKRKKLV